MPSNAADVVSLTRSAKTRLAAGDGTTDDTAAIQAAENELAALGRKVILFFPDGDFGISASLQKKANVEWRGQGKIRRLDNAAPSGAAFALVVANNVDNWLIDGLTLENVTRDLELSTPLTASVGIGTQNTCIDAHSCDNWVVRNCELRKFSQGIMYRECSRFQITDNRLYADTSKTIASQLDGTYSAFSAYTGTGGIMYLYNAGGIAAAKASEFIIRGNYIEAVGLDIGIEALSQTYDEQPGIVCGNIIRGTHNGIQAYRGSFTDSGSAPTYRAALQIYGNRIYSTWEQGIYVRGTIGVSVHGNYIERAALIGAGGVGGSAGAIVTRVNPFNASLSSTFTSAASLSDVVGVDIYDNTIVNPGRDNVALDGALHVRVPHCRVINNRIVRDDVDFPNKTGSAILIDNGETILEFEVRGNEIHNFSLGISLAGGVVAHADTDGPSIIDDNSISACTTGMNLDLRRVTGVLVRRNDVRGATSGIQIRHAPFSVLEQNVIEDCTNGLTIQDGCLASDYRHLKAGSTPSSNRRGATLVVRNNIMNRCTTAHQIANTNGDDASFHGRCAVWSGDVVDGRPVRVDEFAAGTPPTTFTARTWHKGDVAYNTTVAGATLFARVCTAPGTNGNAAATTGDVTNGSAVVANVANFDAIGPGMYLSIDGVTKWVKAIDAGAGTITCDSNFAATTVGAAIARIQPTFVDLVTVGAT